ncbi:MAG TPA: PAS domain-containing sensor histidine kinase [Acidimicrobiia bacterium]|nr:PAS domain-containing sensor histidine kinase [Acidimicrobiia bacterium]
MAVVLDAVIIFGVVYVARPFPGAEASALALTMSSAVVFAAPGLVRLLLPALSVLAAVMGLVNWVIREPVEWSSAAMVGNAVVVGVALTPVLFWMGSSIARAFPTGSLISNLVPDPGEFANVVTERSGEGIAIIDFDSNIRYANPAFASIFGHDRDDLVGTSMARLMDADTYSVHHAAVQRALLSREPIDRVNLELVGRHRDGHPITALVSLSELTGGGERLVLGAVRDATEMVDLRSKLQRLLASKDEFIATVSHELRTPLTAVVAFSEMLLDRANIAESEQDEFIRLIADQSREVAYLIEDLLVSARLESDSMHVAVQPTKLPAEVLSVVGPWATHRRIELDHPALEQSVMADPGRLRQILRNLVANAVKHGGREIGLTAVADDAGRCHVIVRDDGSGVPPERVTSMFDAYSHGANADDQPMSAGLGLHVSRRLAELMGGTLDYRRTGGHTEFVLSLRLAEESLPGIEI